MDRVALFEDNNLKKLDTNPLVLDLVFCKFVYVTSVIELS